MEKFSAYCQCGHVAADPDAWRKHAKECAQLMDTSKTGAIEIRYPDLRALKEQEGPMLKRHGFHVWRLPRYAKHGDEGYQVDEEHYGESLPVYVIRSQAEPQAKERALNKLSKDRESQQALIALLKCTDFGDHGAAIKEFADHI